MEAANHTLQAVIFDLDGVLMDSEWLGFQAWRELVEAHGGRLQDDDFHRITGTSHARTIEIIRHITGLTFTAQETEVWYWERVDALLRAQAQPLPGAAELVQALAGQGVPLAIASNAALPYINDALDGLGLAGYFPVRAGIDQVARGKPAPDVYLEAARRLGADPTRCLAVEDSRVGAQAAAAAGMRLVAIPDRRDPQPEQGYEMAWRVFPSLVEAKPALLALF
jgi:HAD superfamily hydrolase (TIGR01509 family)